MLAACVVVHSLQETAKSSLIFFGNLPVLIENLVFFWTGGTHQRPPTREDVRNINAQGSDCLQVTGIRTPCASFVASLRIAIDASGLCKIVLLQVQPHPFLTQPFPDRSFRRRLRCTTFQAFILYKTKFACIMTTNEHKITR